MNSTDLPIIVSGDTVGILDPHKKYTNLTGTEQKAGLDDSLSNFMKCPGHAACFNGIFGLDTTTVNYQGTLFRFPLRKRNANSEIIIDTAYPPERVLETLYDSFFEEAPLILLFLKHVQEISLYEGSKLLYKVAIDPLQKQVVTAERQACKESTSHPNKCVLRAYSTTVQVHRGGTSENYHWLIMNLIGRQTKQSQQLGFLPWVGIAAPLPGTITLRGLNIQTDKVELSVSGSSNGTSVSGSSNSKTVFLFACFTDLDGQGCGTQPRACFLFSSSSWQDLSTCQYSWLHC